MDVHDHEPAQQLIPDDAFLAELDRRSDALRAHADDPEAMADLWSLVYGLKRWFFIQRGPAEQPQPYIGVLPEGPMVLAFSTPDRARAGARAVGLGESESTGALAVPLPDAADWIASYAGSGVVGICFDFPQQGYTAPLANVVPMRDWFARRP